MFVFALLDLFLRDRKAMVLTSLYGQSTLLAVDGFARDGQVEVAMPQSIVDFSDQAIPCLIKLRFIAVDRCHVV